MSFGIKKKAVLIAFLAMSVAAFAKPAHLHHYAGRSVACPVRHPGNAPHGLWKLVKAVF